MIPDDVRARWSAFAGREIRPLDGGLINATFVVGDNAAILQRLHPVFAPEVNEDIDAVTAHLSARGLTTPRLIRPDSGDACVVHGGETWRALTFVDGGRTFHKVPSPEVARAAGALVGRFHEALADLDYAYRFTRAGVHDTPAHLEVLRSATGEHAAHRLIGDVRPLADEILEAAAALPDLRQLPQRNCHGDLKISNLLFKDQDEPEGLCLVDLDTLGLMSVPFELGDALRSWCNPHGEDAEGALDLAIFEAAVAGYAETAPPLTQGERAHLVDGLATISLELSARFLADALNEAYFGWDEARFATRGDHNLARAKSQLALFRSVQAQADEASALVERAFNR
jgi:Ser/Thr protein kinase RdoA (MazF antagonist)